MTIAVSELKSDEEVIKLFRDKFKEAEQFYLLATDSILLQIFTMEGVKSICIDFKPLTNIFIGRLNREIVSKINEYKIYKLEKYSIIKEIKPNELTSRVKAYGIFIYLPESKKLILVDESGNTISRMHLLIARTKNSVIIMDHGPCGCGTTNGTYLILSHGKIKLPIGAIVELSPGIYILRLGESESGIYLRIVIPKKLSDE